MALSIKSFQHPVDCPQPSNYINVNYHATDFNQLCSGNGSLYQIWGDYANLADVYSNNNSSTGSNSDLCSNGMDVVFLIDYTSSMGGEIDQVKTGITDLINTIHTESNEDYRLGLVIFDEYSTNGTINYQNTPTYAALPNAQKIDTTQNNTRTVITCLHKMGAIGNSGNFQTELNKLNTQNLPLGNGSSFPEPGGIAGNEIINGFAGNFRADAIKLVILITDAAAGGDDDNVSAADTTFFNNTLIPNASNNNVQFLIQTNYTNEPNYSNLASQTIPQGLYDNNVNFANNNWPTVTLAPYITQLCNETFTYNCDPAPAGWYMEPGAQTGYYWDGSAWTQTQTCTYTVTVDLVDNISNGTVDQIGSSHANYSSASQFTFTGVAGTSYDITWDSDPNTYYNNLTINGCSSSLESGSGNLLTQTNNGTNADASNSSLTAEEFRFYGTIQGDASYELTISGSASAIVYKHSVIVRSDIYDTGGSGTAGLMNILSEENGWLTGSWTGTSGQSLVQFEKDFNGTYNSSHTWAVSFAPNPSSYDLVLDNSYNVAYSNSTVSQWMNSNSSVVYNHTAENLGGSFTMPPVFNGTQTYTITGQSNEPQFTTQLAVSEVITGASIHPSYATASITGYTGDSTTISIPLSLDTDYSDVSVNVVSDVTVAGLAANALVSNLSFSAATNTVSFDLEVGSSNISGTMEIDGTATQTQHTYTVTFQDPYTDSAAWQTITYTGVTGSFHATTHPISNHNSPDTTYYITGVSNNDSTNLVSSNNNSGVADLNIVLASMPQGGGSALVSVTGSEESTAYTYTITFQHSSLYASWNNSINGVTSEDVVITGAAGTTHNVSNILYAHTDYEFTQASATPVGILGNTTTIVSSGTYDDTVQFSGSLTMPSGGGAATVTMSIKTKSITYSYAALFQTNLGSTGVDAQYNSATGVVATNNNNGTYTLVFSGIAGATVTGPTLGVNSNNTTDYDAEITGFSYSAGAGVITATEISPWGSNDDAFSTSIVMPSGGGSGTITVSTTNNAITHSFTLNSTSSIPGVSIDLPDQSVTYYGTVNDKIPMNTVNAVLASGYSSYDITSVNTSNGISATISGALGSERVDGEITMPSGGGTGALEILGTSTQTTHPLVVDYDLTYQLGPANTYLATDSLGNNPIGTGGAYDHRETFTGIQYSQNTVTRYVVPKAGYHSPDITSMSTFVTSGGTNWAFSFVEGLLTNGARAFTYSYSIQSSGSGVGIGIAGTIGVVPTTLATTVPTTLATTLCEGYTCNNATPPLLTWSTSAFNCKQYIGISFTNECAGQIASWLLTGNGNLDTTPPQAQTGQDYLYDNLCTGTYTVQVTFNNGCVWTSSPIVLANPTPAPTTIVYYYHQIEDCSGNPYVARSTFSLINGQYYHVGLNPPGFDTAARVTSGPLSAQAYDVTIYSGPHGPSICIPEEEGGEDPVGPKGDLQE